MTKYIGRVSHKHKKGLPDYADLPTQCGADWLAFFAAKGGHSGDLAVYEEGECGEPHSHFFFESNKSLSTLQGLLKKHHGLPPKVRVVLAVLALLKQRAYIYALL